MHAHCEVLPPSGARIILAGELTLLSAADLGELLAAQLAVADRIAVDLSAVTAIDLTAIQLLIAAHRQATEQGKRIELAAAPAPAVRRLCAAGGLAGEAAAASAAGGDLAELWRGS